MTVDLSVQVLAAVLPDAEALRPGARIENERLQFTTIFTSCLQSLGNSGGCSLRATKNSAE
jgi:hypothetical protein